MEIQKPKVSVIFDLDGTLVDSEKTWRKAMGIFMEDLGLGDKTDEVNAQLVGLTEKDAMQKLTHLYDIPVHPEKLSEKRLDIVHNLHATDTELFEGVHELLSSLEESNYKTALATATDRALCDYLISKHNLRRLFDVILSAHDVERGKPHPEVFLKAAEAMCVDPSECIVVEDSPRGLEAARGAGMKTIAVKHDGIFSDEELLSKNPNRLVNHIKDLSIEDFEKL